MAWSLLVVPSAGLRWRALAAAALTGGLVAALLVPVRASRPRTVVCAAAEVTPPAPAVAAPTAPSADDCRPALEAWSATREAAAQDVDGRFRADRERAIDACLAPRR